MPVLPSDMPALLGGGQQMIGNVLQQAKEATISAVITRADGTVEHLGVISYWHKNPLRRLMWRIRQFLRKAA